MCEQEWLEPYWVEPDKHQFPHGATDWGEVVVRTGEGRRIARYRNRLPNVEIETIEMSFQCLLDGATEEEFLGGFIFQKRIERFYYVICDGIVGASLGQETNIVKVRYHQVGSVHGHPITERELIGSLRKHNRDELQRYQKIKG